MIKYSAMLITLVAAIGFSAAYPVHASDKPTACEKKADKKKITDAKKREAFIKKCEKKAKDKDHK